MGSIMNFIQRVKAAFSGKKASKHVPAVPSTVPKEKKPHVEKAARGPRFVEGPKVVSEPEVWRGGPRKKRGEHRPAAAPAHARAAEGGRAKKPAETAWDPAATRCRRRRGRRGSWTCGCRRR